VKRRLELMYVVYNFRDVVLGFCGLPFEDVRE
jgi:hypothetical protein